MCLRAPAFGDTVCRESRGFEARDAASRPPQGDKAGGKADLIDPSFVTVPAAAGPRWRRRLGWLLVALVGATGAVYVFAPQYLPQALQFQTAAGTRGGRGTQRPDVPVPVLVAAAKKEDVPVYFDGVG